MHLKTSPSSSKTLLARLLAKLPQPALDILVGKLSYWLGGVLIGLALFVEDTHRRGELAMYVLPKALESAWIILRGHGAVPRTGRYGDAMLTAVGMGMVMVSRLVARAGMALIGGTEHIPERPGASVITCSQDIVPVCRA